MQNTHMSAIVAAAELSRLERVFERLRPNGIGPDVGDPEEVAAELSWAATRLALYKSQVLMRRNSTIPAVRLPADILLYIFREAVSLDRVNPDTTKLPVSTHAFLVSHVCHQWRNLALANPTLWSTLFTVWRNKSIMEDLAMRVASVPLTIYTLVPDHQARLPELFSMVAPSIRALHIHAVFSTSIVIMLPGHEHLLPVLEELHLVCSNPSDIHDVDILETFTQRTPALQTLVLRNYIISSDASFLARITRLAVTIDHSEVLIQYLLQLLSHVPLAEDVTLDTNIDHGAPFEPPGALCVMRNMKELRLLDSPLILSKILPYLRLPASASLILLPTGEYGHDNHLPTLLNAIETHPHIPRSSPLTHLLVTLDSDGMLYVNAKTVEGRSTQLEISIDLHTAPLEPTLQTLADALPASRVLELNLLGTEMNRVLLRRFLTDSTRLERLSLSNDSGHYMLEEYSTDEALGWLRSLQELRLTYSYLTRAYPDISADPSVLHTKTTLDVLKNFLTGFQRVNGPLPQLTLIQCIVTRYVRRDNGGAIDVELEEAIGLAKEVREGLSEDFVTASGLRDLVDNLRVWEYL
jgi:hypothetical protein